MLRNLPFSTAAAKLGRTQAGNVSMTTDLKWFFMPPAAGVAEGRFSGTSIRMRVSWVPIWYIRIGGALERITWP